MPPRCQKTLHVSPSDTRKCWMTSKCWIPLTFRFPSPLITSIEFPPSLKSTSYFTHYWEDFPEHLHQTYHPPSAIFPQHKGETHTHILPRNYLCRCSHLIGYDLQEGSACAFQFCTPHSTYTQQLLNKWLLNLVEPTIFFLADAIRKT